VVAELEQAAARIVRAVTSTSALTVFPDRLMVSSGFDS
jgi:hypothetical protein